MSQRQNAIIYKGMAVDVNEVVRVEVRIPFRRLPLKVPPMLFIPKSSIIKYFSISFYLKYAGNEE